MLFFELRSLVRTPGERIPVELLSGLWGIVPNDVLEQFVSDHGSNPDFQDQNGHLNLCEVVWQRIDLPAYDIVQASIYPRFRDWTGSVASRLHDFGSASWACIDARKDVVEFWSLHQTWQRAPVMLDGALVGRSSRLHLAEGHTRLGTLRGLVSRNIIPADSRHQLWLGKHRQAKGIDKDNAPGAA